MKLNKRNRKIAFSFLSILIILILALFYTVNSDNNRNKKTIRFVTHNSFVFTPKLLADFERKSGYKVQLISLGDVGVMVNKLILTKSNPIGDLVFGLDNTYLPIAKENGIIQDSAIPTDSGEVCFNFDKNWFTHHHISPPKDLNALTKPDYRNLTVIENPNTSSTGLAFLAATVEKYSAANWPKYWRALQANGVKVVNDWESAYYTDFSGSSGKGNYPIVLSYDTSPADEIRAKGKSQDGNLLDGCFKQTEYVALLTGSKNITGAQVLEKYLLSSEFQSSFPSTMYMFPINPKITLPQSWRKAVVRPTKTYGDTLPISQQENSWLTTWNEIFHG
jgi:thiamine transport system substrate-binding protein